MKKILIGIIIFAGISVLYFNFSESKQAVDKSGVEKSMTSSNSSADSSIGIEPQGNLGQSNDNVKSDKATDKSNNVSNEDSKNSSPVASGTSTTSKSTAQSSEQIDDEEEKKNESIVDKLLPDKVEDKVDAIASGDVSASDLLGVIKIVGGKLSIKEISYLFNSAKSDYWINTSVEDIEKARGILFEKLSDDDLDKLRVFGNKYGKAMDIINKDIDVTEHKEKRMSSVKTDK